MYHLQLGLRNSNRYRLVKSPPHQVGTAYLTSHRLFYVPSSHKDAFSLSLGHVKQTDFYAGLLRSSAKVTLHLASAALQLESDISDSIDQDLWECEVCGNKNVPGSTFASKNVCALCGVPRSAVPVPEISTSTPITRPQSAVSETLAAKPEGIACPACTLINSPLSCRCDLCNTALPISSRPSSAPPEEDVMGPGANLIKLSFRNGGDKAFYAVLKRSLKGKVWQVRDTCSTRVGLGPNR